MKVPLLRVKETNLFSSLEATSSRDREEIGGDLHGDAARSLYSTEIFLLLSLVLAITLPQIRVAKD